MNNSEDINELGKLIARKEEELKQLQIREEELRPDILAHTFKTASEGLRLRSEIEALSEDLRKYRQQRADLKVKLPFEDNRC